MPRLEWTDSYEIGIATFDDDHRRLVEIINRLNDALKHPDQQAMMGDLLHELSKCTIEHFHAEEDFMRSVHFDGFKEHHKEHEKLKRKLYDHMDALDMLGETIEVGHISFLGEWLMKHIREEDTKYAQFARMQGLA